MSIPARAEHRRKHEEFKDFMDNMLGDLTKYLEENQQQTRKKPVKRKAPGQSARHQAAAKRGDKARATTAKKAKK